MSDLPALSCEILVIVTDVTGVTMQGAAKRKKEITYLLVPHLLPHGLLQNVDGTALQKPQCWPVAALLPLCAAAG